MDRVYIKDAHPRARAAFQPIFQQPHKHIFHLPHDGFMMDSIESPACSAIEFPF
jgi:hypothetical protein